MHIFRAEEVIHHDPATVWRYLTVPELIARWMSSVSGLETDDGRPLRARSGYTFVGANGARSRGQVVACESERLIALQSVQAGFTATYAYRILPNGDGCRVVLEADCSGVGLARLFAPLIRPLIRRTDGEQVQAMKRVVEADDGT